MPSPACFSHRGPEAASSSSGLGLLGNLFALKSNANRNIRAGATEKASKMDIKAQNSFFGNVSSLRIAPAPPACQGKPAPSLEKTPAWWVFSFTGGPPRRPRQTRRCFFEAAKQKRHALERASEGLKADREVVLEAVKQEKQAPKYASLALRGGGPRASVAGLRNAYDIPVATFSRLTSATPAIAIDSFLDGRSYTPNLAPASRVVGAVS